jgi:hypothetical protein
MDPFTISTGVAGFLSLTIEIIKILNDYASGVSSATKEASDLLAEANALKPVLEQLVEVLRSEEAQQVPFDKNAVLYSTITLCQAKIEGLYKKLRGLCKPKTEDSGTSSNASNGHSRKTNASRSLRNYDGLQQLFSFHALLRIGLTLLLSSI